MKTIYKNALIYTVDQNNPWADMLVVEDKKISFVGKEKDAGKEAAKADRIIDCEGKMIFPSFIDSHCHPGWVSESMWHVILPDFYTLDELKGFVKKYLDTHPKEEEAFVLFEYYLPEIFQDEQPRREMLDDIAPDRPVLLNDFSGHMSWCNTKMLELMGVDKDTPDPDELAVYDREEDGTPTGWIKEMAWTHHVENMYKKLNWFPPDGLAKENISKVFNIMAGFGYTGMFCAFIEDEQELKSAYELDREGKLNAYFDASYRCDSIEELDDAIQKVKELSTKYTTEHVKINTMKLFIDGTMAIGNVGLLEPLSNDPEQENCGVMALSEEELVTYFTKCNRADLDVHIHTCGDRSFRSICNAVEKIQRNEAWNILVTIAHCGIVNEADYGRPAELGISLNLTPHWCGGEYGDSAIEYIGYDRWINQGTYRPLVYSGALVAMSSDTISYEEIHRSNPFVNFEIGNTRVDPEYPLDPETYPGSVMPPAEDSLPYDVMIEGFTLGGAKQMHIDHLTGSLEAGKNADFVIVLQNIFETEPAEVHKIEVLETVFEGKTIYRKES